MGEGEDGEACNRHLTVKLFTGMIGVFVWGGVPQACIEIVSVTPGRLMVTVPAPPAHLDGIIMHGTEYLKIISGPRVPSANRVHLVPAVPQPGQLRYG